MGETRQSSFVARRPETVGLGVMLALGLGAVAIAAEWVTGAASYAVGGFMLVVVVLLIWTIVMGGTETRRAMAPYGLLKPGVLWLCLFFLAPLWSMMVMSLSSK